MQRAHKVKLFEAVLDDETSGFDAGEDPRAAIARINKEIIAHQSAGRDVPARLMRLSQALSLECAMQSQGR